MILKLISRYGNTLDTEEKIKEFNEFYDLEESRLNQERQVEIEWDREELTRLILFGKGEYYKVDI